MLLASRQFCRRLGAPSHQLVYHAAHQHLGGRSSCGNADAVAVHEPLALQVLGTIHQIPRQPGFLGNLVPVALGNIVGGAGGVALTYWLAYRPRG